MTWLWFLRQWSSIPLLSYIKTFFFWATANIVSICNHLKNTKRQNKIMRWKTFSPTAMSVNQKFSVLQTKLYLTSRTVSCTWNSQPSLLFSQSIVARWPFFPPIRRNLKVQEKNIHFRQLISKWQEYSVLIKSQPKN